MSKPNNLLNQRFGNLLVLERAENDKHGKTRWLCQCDCGQQKIINASSLKRGLTVSCGCNKLKKIQEYNNTKVIDETGNIYGYLTVISRNLDPEMAKDGRAMWNCRCQCGNIHVVSGKMLRDGKTTSCGCRRQSLGEEAVEKLLLANGLNYAKEYLVAVRKEQIYQHHKARFDFAIFSQESVLLYLIEYDGEQHFKDRRDTKSFWGNLESFEQRQERDNLKNQWCQENNIPLIRIPYTHLKNLCIEDLLLETTTFAI